VTDPLTVPRARDPLALIEDVDSATARLLATARAIDDVGAPSLLPDWSRGHLLTHIARNADSMVNLLTWARTGVETPQYAPGRRDADIEAGAARPIEEQVADLESSAVQFALAVASLPTEGWAAEIRYRSGRAAPAATVVWSRLSEVEIHHADLGASYGWRDWPVAFAARQVRQVVHNTIGREGTPHVLLRAPELGRDVALGVPGTNPQPSTDPAVAVIGSAAAIAAWLTGRSSGADLTLDPPGRLPAMGAWG
jgi:maleylpyruvate isomerase